MTWTTTPPTEEGWYWHQEGRGTGFSFVKIDLVYEMDEGLMWFIGDNLTPVEQIPGEWAGPLTPPEEG